MSQPEQLAPLPRPLPPRIAYYLRHLLHGRFRLIPAPALQPPPPPARLLYLGRERLQQVPESPAFRAALAALPPGRQQLAGWIWVAEARRPVLVLETLGCWTLRLPKWGLQFQTLRSIRTRADLRPARTSERVTPSRNMERRYEVPLRYPRDATLVIAVTQYPSGALGYEVYVWHAVGPRQRQMVPLLFEEAQRVVGLFQARPASAAALAPPPDPNG